MQIKEGLYFRSPRLATRFESNAANIAKVLVKALLNLIIKFNIQEIQVVKNSQDHISSVFSLKIHRQNIQNALRYADIPPHFQPIVWFLSFRTVPKIAPKPANSFQQVCWKRHRISGVVGKQRNIGFVGFLGNVEQKWCRKYRKWLCCEIFVTKCSVKASLAVWLNLLPYIFQGGLQPSNPPRRAAPA